MVRYSKLGYIALNVTDVARSEEFYGPEIVGLELTGRLNSGASCLRCSADHHNVILYKGEHPGLKRIGWEVESEESLEQLRRRLSDAGCKIVDVGKDERAELHQGPSFRVREPHSQATFEFYVMMGNYGGKPYVPTVTKIARLGHTVLNVPDLEAADAFYQQTLNFRVSDMMENFVVFYRCWPNPFHHSFGISKGAEPRFGHINFMVTDMEDIGKALGRFTKRQVRIAWGPGRHPPSGSIFFYFFDPDGMTVEYSFGMEEFPEVNPRKPRLLLAIPENGDSWEVPLHEPLAKVGGVEILQA